MSPYDQATAVRDAAPEPVVRCVDCLAVQAFLRSRLPVRCSEHVEEGGEG